VDLNRHWMVWNDISGVVEGFTAAT
jgi:hypothetical protein